MATQKALIPGVEDRVLPNQEHPEDRKLFELMLGDLPWADDYLDLVAQFGWRKAAYIAWASQPPDLRIPKTVADTKEGERGFASLIGCSPRAIRGWRQKNSAIDMAICKVSMGTLLEARAGVYEALIESASNPSYRHAPDRRTYLQLTGDLEETHNHNHAMKPTQMSNDELREAAGLT